MNLFAKKKIVSLIGCSLLAGSAIVSMPTEAATQPNIILFLIDDMGLTDTSLQFTDSRVPNNDFFRTPNMETMAKKGVKFTQAYSHPVCTPSRVSLMTGQSPARHHVSNWTMLPGSDAQNGKWGQNTSPTDWRTEGLQPSDVLLSKELQKAGYYTIQVGKAHFGSLGTKGEDPLNMGFDANVAGHAAGAPASYQGDLNFGNDFPILNDYPQGVPHLEEFHGKDIHLTDVLTLKAKSEMDKAVATGKPFFLNMAHYAVHTPIEQHKQYMKNYEDKFYKNTDIKIPIIEAKYASLVEGMDASLGEMMEYLEKTGIAENTLIIFTSDNGGLSGHTRGTSPMGTELNTHYYPLRSGKGSAYEGGSRVPYIVAWGKTDVSNSVQKILPISPNTISDELVVIQDLFPSILKVANATPNLPKGYVVDGRDVTGAWSGGELPKGHAFITHYPHVWGPFGDGYQPHSTMILDKKKIIYYYNSRTWEMYDLITDIGERFNLVESQPEELKRLANYMRIEMTSMNAQYPVNRYTGKVEPLMLPAELGRL